MSYRRADTPHVAGRLFDRLEARFGTGNVFMDVDSIEPGLDFAETIEEAVGSCDVLLALIGARWVEAVDEHGGRRLEDPDDFVVLEITAALRRQIRVIPVLVDGAPPPQRGDLPEALAALARRQGIRLEHTSFGTGVAALMTALERVLRTRTMAPEDQQPSETLRPTSPQVSRRTGGRRSGVPAASVDIAGARQAAPNSGEAAGWNTGRTGPNFERQLTGHTGIVLAVTTAQLGGRLVVVSSSNDATLRVWDPRSGQQLLELTGHIGSVRALGWSPDRSRLVSGGDDRSVRVWDLATGQLVGSPFAGHTEAVWAVTTAQLDGQPVVISGSTDRTVRVWDLATGRPVGSAFTGHTRIVRAVVTAQLDGRQVVISGGNDRSLRVWDLATRQPIGSPFTGHTDAVRAVTTAQLDGHPVVISGSDDNTVRVWDLATGEPIGSPLTGHTNWVQAVTTAPLDGRTVVITGSTDKTVRVWDLPTGQPVGSPLTGHTHGVYAVITAQLDGRTVVITGCGDQTVRVWDLAARAHS